MHFHNQGGIIDADEEAIVKRLRHSVHHLSVTFPDPIKASEDFNAFAKLNENRLYKLLKTCLDPQTDLKTLIRSMVRFNFFQSVRIHFFFASRMSLQNELNNCHQQSCNL